MKTTCPSMLDLLRAAIEAGAGTPARPVVAELIGQRGPGGLVRRQDAEDAWRAALESGRVYYDGRVAVFEED